MSLNDIRICCPKCDWEPDGGEYWQCHCGHVWDTFTTAARCPACHYQHEYTSCIDFAGGCLASSPHQDWYRGLDKVVEEIMEEAKEEVGSHEIP